MCLVVQGKVLKSLIQQCLIEVGFFYCRLPVRVRWEAHICFPYFHAVFFLRKHVVQRGDVRKYVHKQMPAIILCIYSGHASINNICKHWRNDKKHKKRYYKFLGPTQPFRPMLMKTTRLSLRMCILIPLTTFAQRNNISNPTPGLMAYSIQDKI